MQERKNITYKKINFKIYSEVKTLNVDGSKLWKRARRV